ncbi:MAG TPA: cellulase family glycosylhydrolase [Polyangiaceae bacterium]
MQRSSVLAAVFLCVGCSSSGSSPAGGGSGDGGGAHDASTVGESGGGADSGGKSDTGGGGGDSGGGGVDSGTSDAGGGDGGTSTATRPPYNTGPGFFVLNGKLYDANGKEFRMRGVDRNHYDSNSQAGIAKSGANTVRIFVETNYGESVAGLVGIVQNQHIAEKEVPIPTAPSTTTGTGTSCSSDPAVLTSVVANWVATASSWTPLDKYQIVNIANEWGPANSTVWRDSYISAIASMRAAGYLGTLLVDAGGCGQDLTDLVTYSGAVFQSDPQKNVMFALHLYGSVNDYSASISGITKGNPTVVTLSGTSVCHPFARSYCPTLSGMTNTYSGLTAYQLSGVAGMTQINGMQAAPQNVGGSSGAWTVTLNVDSTSFGDYTSGGTIVDYNGNYGLLIPRLAALASTTGAAYAVTEFGPGRNIGPSPTLATPLEIVGTAEANNLGWVAWAWDDNNLANAQTDNEWFGMTYNGGAYTQDTDLTMFGQQIVEGCTNPTPGGCGCPDGLPLPPYFDPDNPTATTPAVYAAVDPGCKGTPAPTTQPASLKLAVPATIF